MFGKKFYTIIVVPHAKAKFRKLRVPYALIMLAGMMLAGTIAGVGILTYRYTATQVDAGELTELRSENRKLRRENERTRDITTALERRLDGFQETVGKFKVMFGVGGDAGGTGEVGGRPPETPQDRYNAFAYLSRLKADAESLAEEFSHISAEVEERVVAMNSTPTIRPVKNGFVSSRFGYRTDPFTGKRTFHPALDISTWYWDEVFSPADGVVVRTDRNRGSGNFIELSHGFGYTTLYAHLKKFNVKPGQEVKRGDVIGYVGNTGRSTGPHLHYEVRFHGKAVNPTKFILD